MLIWRAVGTVILVVGVPVGFYLWLDGWTLFRGTGRYRKER